MEESSPLQNSRSFVSQEVRSSNEPLPAARVGSHTAPSAPLNVSIGVPHAAIEDTLVESSIHEEGAILNPLRPPSPRLSGRGSPPPNPSTLRRVSRIASEGIHEPQLASISRNVLGQSHPQDVTSQEMTLPSMMQLIVVRGKTGGVLKPEEDCLDEASVTRLKSQRVERLQNMKQVYDTQQLTGGHYRASSKYFPQTAAWYVAGLKGSNTILEKTMTEIGAAHGIVVILDLPDDQTYSCVPYTLHLDDNNLFKSKHIPWVQDVVDFHPQANEIHCPLILYPEQGRSQDLSRIIEQARLQRDADWGKRKLADGTEISAPKDRIYDVGRTVGKLVSLKSLSLASATNATPVINLTYNEGGNTLLGVDTEGLPFAIIGKDSVAISKAIMEQQLGREMNENEVKMAFAIDYGLSTEQVFFVEQPGSFHLDMSMAIIGNRTIVLNDAVAAAESYQVYPREANKQQCDNMKMRLITEAMITKMFEDKTARDLEQYGFKVIRTPGVFRAFAQPEGEPHEQMNFFNMVTATTPAGGKIVVINGMIDEYKDRFRSMLGRGDVQPDDIYFIDFETSIDCLWLGGGIACRTKTIGT